MPKLYFKVASDVDKVIKLRNEITRLKNELKSCVPSTAKEKVAELEKSLEDATTQFRALVSEAATLAGAFKMSNEAAKEIKATTQATNEATDTFVKHTDSIESLKSRLKDLTKEYRSLSAEERAGAQGKALTAQMSTISGELTLEAEALRSLQREYINTQKQNELQEGSIKSLRIQISTLNAAYDSLSREQRKAASGTALLTQIQTVTKELNDAEAASMRFQRNVGNYASGWNGLNVQMQQVARELPSLAIGANTFFLAISNNLPMLADEIKKARAEYKQFTAEGKNATPVWQQMFKSLFSWQTALVAGITILSMYGKEMISWVGSMMKGKKALSDTFQSLNEYQKKVGESSGTLMSALESLSTRWKQLGTDVKDQERFLVENKSAIDKMGVAITNVTEAENVFNSHKAEFINGIIQRAKAAAAMELAAEEYKKAVQKMVEAESMPDKKVQTVNVGGNFSPSYQSTEYANPDKPKAMEEAQNYMDSATKLVQKAIRFSEEENKILENANIESTQTMVEGSVEAIRKAIAIKEEALSKVTTSTDYKRIEAEIKADKSKLNAITGESDKLAADRYIDSDRVKTELERSSQAIKDAIDKTELEIRQKNIDLLAEGSEKEIEQIRLNYDKRKDEIAKNERELLKQVQEQERKIWERDNPDFKKSNKQFTPTTTSLTPEQAKPFAEAYDQADKQKAQDTKAVLDGLLEKYKDFSAQRKSIEEQYNKDIEELENQRADSNSESIDRAIAVAKEKMSEALQSVNDAEANEKTNDTGFFKNLFGDYSQMSINSLQNLIGQARKLRDYLSGKGDKEGITFITPEQLAALEKSPTELEALKKALDKLIDGDSQGYSNPWQNIIDSTKKGIAQLKNGNDFKSISGGVSSIGSAASTAATNIADMFSQMGEDEIAEAVSGIGELMGSVSNIAEGFSKGGIVGGITAVVGELTNFIAKAVAANSRHKQALSTIMNEAIAQQRAYNLLLMEQNLLYEEAATIFGTDKYAIAANAAANLESAIKALNKELRGTEEQQKKVDKYASFVEQIFGVKDPEAELKKAYAGLANIQIVTGHKKTGIFGWGSGKDTYSSVLAVYPELIDGQGKFNIELAQTIIDTRRMSDESKAALQNIIDLAEQAEAAYEAMHDYLTDIFGDLGNSMMDSLVSAFEAGTDAAQDFTDSVSEMLENLAKQMIYSVTIAPLLEKAQTEMEKVMQDTGLEEDEKFAQWSAILGNLVSDAVAEQGEANRLLEVYQQLAAEQGFDLFDSEKSSQTGSSSGFATASQESIDELNGRFAALQQSNEEIKVQSYLHTEYLGKTSNIADEMRNMMVDAYMDIADIKNNTGQTVVKLNGVITELKELKKNI